MVKGISRRVVVVDSPDQRFFEQAIFIVRNDAAGEGVTARELVEEARRVARNYAGGDHGRFSRIWRDDLEPDEPFAVDSIGNDIVPDKVEVARYTEEPFRDKEGLYDAPYLFYFDKGENVIRLTGVRECAAVAGLTLYEEKQPVSYAEYAAAVDTAAAAGQTIGYAQNYQA